LIFDPVLDKKLRIEFELKQEEWNGCFVCYPGQRVAHLHKKAIDSCISRFIHVGYPGTFNYPVYHSQFRTKVIVNTDTLMRWQTLSGRLRMNVNGLEFGILDREYFLKKGEYTLLVINDFASTLPCIIIDGIDADCQWEASLSGKEWMRANCMLECKTPEISPLASRERTYLVPVKQIICQQAQRFIVDFHYYELGSVSFVSRGTGNLTVIIGQSVEEVENKDASLFEQKQMEPIVLNKTDVKYETSMQCLRYALFSWNDSCNIDEITFKAKVTPVEYKGSFSCEDELLTQAWYLGAATIHSCMHDFFLDAIYRDSLPWALDGIGAIQGSDMVFFDRETANNHVVSQLLPQGADQDDLGVIYLDFQLYTILGFEYNYQTGRDFEFLMQHKEKIYDTLKIYLSLRDEYGFIGSKQAGGKSFFPDWSADSSIGPDSQGTPTYAQMLLMHCLEFGSFVSELYDDLTEKNLFSKAAKDMREKIPLHFWSQTQRAYINGYSKDKKIDEEISVYAQAFGVLFGLVDAHDYDSIYSVMRNPKFRYHRISLNMHWELLAYAKMGKINEMISIIKEIATPIVKHGDVRVYEDINTNGSRSLDFYGRPFGKSLCHAVMGSAFVTAISMGVLGITPSLKKEYDYEFKVNGNSLRDVQGVVPTRHGNIIVNIKNELITIVVCDKIKVKLIDLQTEDSHDMISESGIYKLSKLQ